MAAIYDQTGWTTPTGVGPNSYTRTVLSTDSTVGRTINITYVVSAGGDGVMPKKKPEPIDMTDWAGLSRCCKKFSASQTSRKPFMFIKMPERDPRNKMRLQLQKMRNG